MSQNIKRGYLPCEENVAIYTKYDIEKEDGKKTVWGFGHVKGR